MSANAQAIETSSSQYDLGTGLSIDGFTAVRSGTNLLIMGPSMLGTERIAVEILERGLRLGEHAVIVSADRPGTRIRGSIDGGDRDGDSRLHVIDCCAAGNEAADDDDFVQTVASPGNLTGIGVGLTKATQSIGDGATEGVRVAMLSLSTLLQYTDVDTVFRFVHVATSRFAAAGYLGVATVDPDIHEDRTLNKLKAQFDGAIELREGPDHPEYRVVGFPEVPANWTAF